MNDLTKQWLQYAGDDLRVADILLREQIYTQVCFHAQQCVEKAFKSVLVHLGTTVPRTHSIITLFKLMPAALVTQIAGDVTIFDDFYIPVRYPDTLPGSLADGPPGETEAKQALMLARDIIEQVKQYLTK